MRTWAFACLIASLGLGLASDSLPGLNGSIRMTAGAQLYAIHCASCHGALDALPVDPRVPTHGRAGHTWQHPDGAVIQMIMRGSPITSDMRRPMPPTRGTLSPEEVAAILTYIESSWSDLELELRDQWWGCHAYVVPSC